MARKSDIPYNIEAETSVLAACLLSQDAAHEIIHGLEERDFYRESHRIIFATAKDMLCRAQPVALDAITLKEALAARGLLDRAGGMEYLSDLMANTFAFMNWREHAAVVRRASVLRALQKAGLEIKAIAENAEEDTDLALERAEKALFDATERRDGGEAKPIKDLFLSAYEEIDETRKNGGPLEGVLTGFRSLDGLLGGLHAGDLVILAARPGIGKTSLAQGFAMNAAKSGHPVVFFSLEMSAGQIMKRLVSSESRIPLRDLRQGSLQQKDMIELASLGKRLGELDLFVDDTPGITVSQITAKTRKLFHALGREKPGCGLIIVDYLQLVSAPRRAKEANRALEVGEITRGLKIAAKELGVPILALSQLSRAIETRASKRPMLSDLRESGSIEQDADVVMFIDRSMDAEEAGEDARPDLGIAKIVVAKHRNGSCGTVELSYVPESTVFVDSVS